MALNIRNNTALQGIKVKNEEDNKYLKITQLADDTTLFLNSKTEINTALNVITNFGKHSGLELNRSKTEGMFIGNLKNCTEKIGNINWSKKPIKALGIYFGINKKECNKLNWDSKINDCELLIKKWLRRNLTFFGKIKVIKTLLLSKFVYLAQTTIIPQEYIKKIDSLIFSFLWHGKREKIKRTTLIGQKESGGIEMCDTTSFFKSLKLKWVKYLLNNDNANWKVLPSFYLSKLGENFLIFHSNLDHLKNIESFNKLNIPAFYRDIVELWLQVNINKTGNIKSYNQIRKQIIWYNKNIKLNNKCLLFNDWIHSGLIFINDIINQSGVTDDNLIYNKLQNKKN